MYADIEAAIDEACNSPDKEKQEERIGKISNERFEKCQQLMNRSRKTLS